MGCQPGPRRRWVIAKGCHLQGHEPVMLVGADPVDLNSTSRVEHAQPGPGPARRQQAHAALDKQRFADRQGDLERDPQAPWHAPGCIPGAERLQIDCSWVTSALFHFGVLMPEAMALAPRTAHAPPP
jgi:hypothetical protein